MMFFLFSTVFTPTLLLITLIGQLVSAADDPFLLVRFVFNNGKLSEGQTYCSGHDFQKINEAFPENMRMPTLRHLRSSVNRGLMDYETDNITSVYTNTTTTTRELWPTFCADACLGYLPGTCRATRCVGYRRSRDLLLSQQSTDFACSKLMTSLHANIDKLMRSTEISTTCKNFLVPIGRQTYCGECEP